MILIDQHAAHERIRYETLLKSYEKNMGRAQQLLIPQVIEPGVKESSKLLLMLEEFKKFGLEISHYGGNSFAVQSVPLILGDIDFKPLLLDIASMFKELPTTYEIKKVIYDAIALIACHGSIRGNQKLDLREIKALFQELDKCENSSRCPHGRPIWIKLDWDFIEKSFKRKL
jgi:DNA mismatch repair protein MutL